MKTIWKFFIPIEDAFTISMPKDAKILSLQVQRNNAYIWALCDNPSTYRDRNFRLFGTGHPFDLVDYKYIGTFQMMDGDLVYHLFEI